MTREYRLVIKFESNDSPADVLEMFREFFKSVLVFRVMSGSDSHVATIEINEKTESRSFDLNRGTWTGQ